MSGAVEPRMQISPRSISDAMGRPKDLRQAGQFDLFG